ncbi:sugar kinase [Streptomyces sp. ISL-11]|nr:sugar kinase [Streptomyces sp. ISL-11]
MVTFRPSRPGRLAEVPSFDRGIGGAESNVACALAAAGHRTRWIGRVGADGFGDHVVETIAAYGVDVTAVQRDPRRPTGIYFRTAGERPMTVPAGGPLGVRAALSGTDAPGARPEARAAERPVRAPGSAEPPAWGEVAYYRAGSAASAMAPGLVPRETAWAGRVLHLTGITAALSAGCLALLHDLTAPGPGRPFVSFDVNYRAGLWQDAADGPEVLAALARRCDLVLVGEDEAQAAWGLRGADAVRAALPEPEIVVVKRGAAGATAYVREPGGAGPDGAAARAPRARSADRAVSVPALRVDVVAPVGAGDAFAAGFLSGTLRGLPVEERLRHGHLMAAAALTTPGDLAAPPARGYVDRLAALDDEAWGALRLGPGWTGRPEARTATGEAR